MREHDPIQGNGSVSFSLGKGWKSLNYICSFLGISEIGLATENVRETALFIGSRLGVGVYRGSQEETFAAIGDDHGLLIFVEKGRSWFPDTGKSAGQYPVKVLVLTDDGATYRIAGPPYQITQEGRET